MLYNCLMSQTMQHTEFELIVVDELYNRRGALMESLYPTFKVRHVAPWKSFAVYDNSTGFNTGLRLACGELVCFMVDFMWVYPRYLEDHWDFYRAHPGWSMTGYLDRYPFPQIAWQGEFGYSIFSLPWDPMIARHHFEETVPIYQERKGGAGKVDLGTGLIEMPGELIYLIPDSIPLAVMNQLNGLDELYNGGYGVNDIDVGVRANRIGWKFGLNPNCIVQKLGVPGISEKIPGISKPKIRSDEQNYDLFKKRIAAIRDGRESVAVPEGRGAWK